jgi:hypothetical protein
MNFVAIGNAGNVANDYWTTKPVERLDHQACHDHDGIWLAEYNGERPCARPDDLGQNRRRGRLAAAPRP